MKSTMLIFVFLAFPAFAFSANTSPYQGEESREIKALSADDINGYLNGHGMGLAKAAELNNYPGPKHVLELSEKLSLTPEQLTQTNAIFLRMKNEAVQLGVQLVAKEKELDAAFMEEAINADSLQSLLSEIGEIQVKVRQTHLVAHLEQRELLNHHQLKMYRQLRGYYSAHSEAHHP